MSRLEVRACGGGLLFSQDSARLMGLKLSLRPFLSMGAGEEAFLHSLAFSLDSSWLLLCIRSGTNRDTSPLGRASPLSPTSLIDSGREVSAETVPAVGGESWACSGDNSVPYSRLLRTGCDEISMSWVVFRARGVRFRVMGGGGSSRGKASWTDLQDHDNKHPGFMMAETPIYTHSQVSTLAVSSACLSRLSPVCVSSVECSFWV